jgi:hypothetical protein
MKKDQLLAEIDEILRTMPPRESLVGGGDENGPWLGRAAAAINRWNIAYDAAVTIAVEGVQSGSMLSAPRGISKLLGLLHQARADLRMEVGPLTVVVAQGQVFDYFDEVRKVIEPAQSEVFFVDSYLDAEFVSRYLPHVRAGVVVRLFGGPKRMTTLLPAVAAFAQQSGLTIHVRSSDKLHDRYVFVDQTACYVSGASFKDGAKNAPAMLTQNHGRVSINGGCL